MPRSTCLLVSLVCMLLFACMLSASQGKPLTNDDIKKMASSGFGDDVILSAIAANDTNFDVSVDALTSLKAAGVSDKVLSAILQAAAQKRDGTSTAQQPGASTQDAAAGAPASPTPPPTGFSTGAGSANVNNMVQQMMSSYGMGMGGMASAGFDPSQMPTVTLIDAANRQPMRPSASQVAHTQSKGGNGPSAGMTAAHTLTSVGSEALSFASFAGPYGMMAGPALGMATGMIGTFGGHHGPPKVTKVWALPGHNSSLPLETRSPRFEVSFANLLGIDPDGYQPFLVKLVQSKDNWRLVGTTKTKMSMGMTMGAMDEEALAKVSEVRLPVRSTRTGPGLVQLEPSEALTPGEYGIVLRPIHAGKRSKGSMGGPAEQNVFYSVWDFTVH